jgi:crotonobetainyl-CoA:carnitine CoA-transferase CaiB-like acyl-CoA transferase
MLVQVPHPVLGHTTQAGVVPRLSATPGTDPPQRPRSGRRRAGGLTELGLDLDAAIEALRAAGTVTHARPTP